LVPEQHRRRCPWSEHARRSCRYRYRRPDVTSAITEALFRAPLRSIHLGRTLAIPLPPLWHSHIKLRPLHVLPRLPEDCTIKPPD
jgi:hypothetical protein